MAAYALDARAKVGFTTSAVWLDRQRAVTDHAEARFGEGRSHGGQVHRRRVKVAEEKKASGTSLTLLDQFAMAALTGIYAARRDTAQGGAGGHVPSEAARMAYEAAEAMMKEREKRKVA
jgi:hypothetical protein